ncbi:hypothetical protein E1287_00830 [Actinomadura sp. KC06]|nr:hypothetical protein E1287_00830 [Actinomadura sp. KC06]
MSGVGRRARRLRIRSGWGGTVPLRRPRRRRRHRQRRRLPRRRRPLPDVSRRRRRRGEGPALPHGRPASTTVPATR